MGTVEWVAFLLSLAYVVLNGVQNKWCWPVGAASVIVYAYVFIDIKLYADSALQIIYLAFSIYGWVTWSKMHKESVVKPILTIALKQWGYFLGLTAALFMGIYYVLINYSDDTLPFWDSLTAALSLTATFMNARKYIENWAVWVVTNSLYVGVYWYKDLKLTAFLSLIIAAMSIWAWYKWRQEKSLPIQQ